MSASEQAATSANFCASTMASLQVAEIADSSVVSQGYANSSEVERPPQLPSTFGTSGQRRNARTSANSYASTIKGLQVAEVADSSVVSQVFANRSEGGSLKQLPSMVGTIGQARNTQLGSLHTVAATSENLVSLSARSWQVPKIADNDAVSHISANDNKGEGLQQLPSTVGTAEQRENATTGASERAANFENLGSSLDSAQVTKIANSNATAHGSATRSTEERLLRLPSMAGSSGQLENTRMGPSEHAANLSKFDPLATSSLQGVEKVIHTAVRPASGPCDNERHLPYPADIADAVGEAGRSNSASSDHAANSANSDISMHRGLHESQDNARSIAYTQQVLNNEEQDDVACGEPYGNEDTRFLHSFTHPNTPPPEEADELPDTQRQASLLDSAQTLFEKKMMMEAVNGEQVTFRRLDEILENVMHALELPLLQAERVVAEACRQWSDLERLVSQKLRILNNVRKMCVRMDKACPSW